MIAYVLANQGPGPTPVATATPTTSSTVPEATWATCADVPLEPNSDNMISDLRARGVTCAEATSFARQVAEQHNFFSGPRTFDLNGYACTEHLDDTALPVGLYTCTTGGATITWTKS
jgi:hypothetical protein